MRNWLGPCRSGFPLPRGQIARALRLLLACLILGLPGQVMALLCPSSLPVETVEEEEATKPRAEEQARLMPRSWPRPLHGLVTAGNSNRFVTADASTPHFLRKPARPSLNALPGANLYLRC